MAQGRTSDVGQEKCQEKFLWSVGLLVGGESDGGRPTDGSFDFSLEPPIIKSIPAIKVFEITNSRNETADQTYVITLQLYIHTIKIEQVAINRTRLLDD